MRMHIFRLLNTFSWSRGILCHIAFMCSYFWNVKNLLEKNVSSEICVCVVKNEQYSFEHIFHSNVNYFTGLALPTEATDEDDDDWDEDEESSEADDDGRIYKNPRNSPSTECPRDEEQATLLGQKCLRKCSSDEDCKSKKKKCLCDGACGMSCIKPGLFYYNRISVFLDL